MGIRRLGGLVASRLRKETLTDRQSSVDNFAKYFTKSVSNAAQRTVTVEILICFSATTAVT